MTQLPIAPLSPQEQRRLSLALYARMGAQVKSYHAHYHMGDNSSVPTEVAQELLESMQYTLETAGGFRSGVSLDSLLQQGHTLLSEKLAKGQRLCGLVYATMPVYQSQCRWESLTALRSYLQHYDHLHFAHRIPEDLDYPLLTPVPGSLRGIDHALFYLNCLWLEDQILAAFPDGSVSSLFSRMPPDYWEAPQNLCEQPLWNAVGKHLLGRSLADLTFSDEERAALVSRFRQQAPSSILSPAMDALCGELAFPDPALQAYAHTAMDALLPRLNAVLPTQNLSLIFV